MPETTTKHIRFYICPTPTCPHYYGSTTMGDLSKSWTGPKMEDGSDLEMKTGSPHRHNRTECPNCRLLGNRVQMVELIVPVNVPVEGPPTPPIPSRLEAIQQRQPPVAPAITE